MTDSTHDAQKWLVVILIYADFTIVNSNDPKVLIEGNIKLGLNRLFEDLITTRLNNDQCRLFVIMDRLTYFRDRQDQFRKREQVVRLEIRNTGSGTNDIVSCELLIDGVVASVDETEYMDHRSSLQRVDQLTSILNSIKPHSDEKILFTTWDHGSAFGIFKEDRENLRKGENASTLVEAYGYQLDTLPYLNMVWNKINSKKELPAPLVNYVADFDPGQSRGGDQFIKIGTSIYRIQSSGLPTGRSYLPEQLDIAADKSEKVVVQQTDILSTSELAEALHTWLKEQEYTFDKVSVLLMMNCYMLNLHTMHNLQRAVECLVGSATDISNPCYNFRSILKRINRNGGKRLTSRMLAKHCSYSATNSASRQRARQMLLDPRRTVDSWAIFAVDLQCRDAEDQTMTHFQRQLARLNQILKEFEMIFLREIPEFNAASAREYKALNLRAAFFKYSRAMMQDLTGSTYKIVDVANWLDFFSQLYVARQSDSFLCDETADMIDRFVSESSKMPMKKKGMVITKLNKRFCYLESPVGAIAPLPTGAGVFFPRNQSELMSGTILASAGDDELLKGTLNQWRRFLNRVYIAAES